MTRPEQNGDERFCTFSINGPDSTSDKSESRPKNKHDDENENAATIDVRRRGIHCAITTTDICFRNEKKRNALEPREHYDNNTLVVRIPKRKTAPVRVIFQIVSFTTA